MTEACTLYSPRDVEEACAQIKDSQAFAARRRALYNSILASVGTTPDLNDPALRALYSGTDYIPAFPPESQREDEILIYSEQPEQTDEKPSRGKKIALGTLRFAAATVIAAGLGLATKQMGTHAIEVFKHSHSDSPLTSLESLVQNTAKTAVLGALTFAAPLIPLVYKRKRR